VQKAFPLKKKQYDSNGYSLEKNASKWIDVQKHGLEKKTNVKTERLINMTATVETFSTTPHSVETGPHFLREMCPFSTYLFLN